MERRKYLGQYNKPWIKSYASKIARVDEVNLKGYVSLIKIQEVNFPFMAGEKGAEICIANNGYSELTFLPDNENWMLSTIYNNKNDIVEWYFDVTRKNAIDENDNPYCDDLYLDAALMPDGHVLIFDEDELLDALNAGNIIQQDYAMAYSVVQKLRDDSFFEVTYMEKLCAQLLKLF